MQAALDHKDSESGKCIIQIYLLLGRLRTCCAMSKLKWMFVVFDMAGIAEFIGGDWNNPSLVYDSLVLFSLSLQAVR